MIKYKYTSKEVSDLKKVIVILIFLLLLVACNEQPEEFELDIPDISHEQVSEGPIESKKPELTIEDLGPAFSIKNYNPDEMIQIPYEKELPENVEVMFNSENATVLKFESTALPGRSYVGMKVVNVRAGVDSGKILYKYITTGDGEQGLYGYMNDDFSLLTEGIFNVAYPFVDGNAIVKTSNGYGVIDTDGDYVLPCLLKFMPELFQDIIKVPHKVEQESKEYFCYNRQTGEYQFALKKLIDKSMDRTRYFKITTDGTEEEIFDLSGLVFDGLTKYKDMTTRKWGYKNGFGEIVIEPQFVYAYDFSDGLAKVGMTGKYGFINEFGEIAIPCIYDGAGDFKDGVAMVTLSGTDIMIDKNGKTLMSYDFLVIKGYGDGLAAAVLHGQDKWQYVNENGELAFENKFSSAGTFSNGLALVTGTILVEGTTSKNYFYINTKGEPAFGLLLFYQATELSEEGYALAWHTGSSELHPETAFIYYVIISKQGSY